MVEYRDIEGFPDYQVGDDGSVWSTKLNHGSSAKRRLKGGLTYGGYRTVCLRKDGETYTRSVHSLVAAAFISKCPEGQECRHRNNNPDDNRVENLLYGTKKQNSEDMVLAGRQFNGGSKPELTEEEVIEIRRLRSEGVKLKDLAAQALTKRAIELVR